MRPFGIDEEERFRIWKRKRAMTFLLSSIGEFFPNLGEEKRILWKSLDDMTLTLGMGRKFYYNDLLILFES